MALPASIRVRLGAVLAALLVVVSAAPRTSETSLLKINRRQPVPVPAPAIAEMVVLQELATCWLVEAPPPLASRLLAAGISLEVLDRSTAGRVYYLLFAPTPEQVALAAPLGRVSHVEVGVGLLSSAREVSRAELPAEVAVKRLSGQVAVPLAFETVGRGTAVPRPSADAHQQPYDPRIGQMIATVSQGLLSDRIRGLEAFQTRYASTSNCEAAGTSVHSYFSQLGLETESDHFTFTVNNYATSNIIATIPGQVEPDRTVIVCAHYDSTSTQPQTHAPGADDNASGTAAVMEMARVLAGYQFDYTIKLIAFSAEEWGLYGSRHYAQAARQRGEQIIGVVNLDMIAYPDFQPEELDIIVDGQSEWLGNKYVASASTYAPLPIITATNPSARGSDHSPFWDAAYSALLGIEDTPVRNPYYHKTTDTFETLDMAFATAVTRASLAAVAELAQPVSLTPPPTGVTAQSQTFRSIFTSRKTTVITWDAGDRNIVGYNVYRSLVSHGAYQQLNSSLVKQTYYVDRLLLPDVPYYYVVTAVDLQGRESNYSVEVS